MLHPTTTKRSTTTFPCSILDCHEMVPRSRSPRGWGIRPNYLLVCRICHDQVIPGMPLEQQLAHKLDCDPDHYDLDAINALIAPRQPIEQAEVDEHLMAIRNGGTRHGSFPAQSTIRR